MNKTQARIAYWTGGLIAVALAANYLILPMFGIGSTRLSANCQAEADSGTCSADGTECKVGVAVPACAASAVVVTPPKLYICKNNAHITWNLTSSGSATGAKFASNGINFKPSGTNEFKNPRVTDSTFEWFDKHANLGSFDYELHILTSNAGDCIHTDPLVSNE